VGNSLGRVLDPQALDACAGPRARLRVDVPASWLAEGAVLQITAPSRLTCARCDGGGCDACDRSGALRSPADPEARLVTATLSGADHDADRAVVVRVPRPFGADHGIHQLLVEIRVAAVSSSFVTRVAPPPPPSDAAVRAPALLSWPALALAVAAAIVLALLGR
jgi:hypothetical protein